MTFVIISRGATTFLVTGLLKRSSTLANFPDVQFFLPTIIYSGGNAEAVTWQLSRWQALLLIPVQTAGDYERIRG